MTTWSCFSEGYAVLQHAVGYGRPLAKGFQPSGNGQGKKEDYDRKDMNMCGGWSVVATAVAIGGHSSGAIPPFSHCRKRTWCDVDGNFWVLVSKKDQQKAGLYVLKGSKLQFDLDPVEEESEEEPPAPPPAKVVKKSKRGAPEEVQQEEPVRAARPTICLTISRYLPICR